MILVMLHQALNIDVVHHLVAFAVFRFQEEVEEESNGNVEMEQSEASASEQACARVSCGPFLYLLST